MPSVETVNYLFALGTVALQLGGAALLVGYMLRLALLEPVVAWFSARGLWVGFTLTLAAALGNHYYNQVLGIPPCDLCWWGRIFLYPQVILFGIAAWRRDRAIADYAIVLSVIGAGISLYHHLLQLFPSALPCPATGVSCAQRFLFEFGYITYPMMALSLFAFLIVMMLCVRRSRG